MTDGLRSPNADADGSSAWHSPGAVPAEEAPQTEGLRYPKDDAERPSAWHSPGAVADQGDPPIDRTDKRPGGDPAGSARDEPQIPEQADGGIDVPASSPPRNPDDAAGGDADLPQDLLDTSDRDRSVPSVTGTVEDRDPPVHRIT